MIKEQTNPSFTLQPDVANALGRLASASDDFQLLVAALEERRIALALGTAQPEMREQRAEFCGRVQELGEILRAVNKATRRQERPPVTTGKAW